MKKYRTECESNIYHVTTRGVGRQLIFEDDADRRHFGALLRAGLESSEGELYAWCFMGNHVHLLVHLDLCSLSILMKAVLSPYASYFNEKHDRVGHLFQSRFDSVPIETGEQLLAAVRYIHQNPLGDLADTLEDYRWSSYREYLTAPFITTTKPILSLFGSIEEFVAFHMENGSSYDSTKVRRARSSAIDDDQALEIARVITGFETPAKVAELGKRQRDHVLARLKGEGLAIRQIERITGIGRNIIQRAK